MCLHIKDERKVFKFCYSILDWNIMVIGWEEQEDVKKFVLEFYVL